MAQQRWLTTATGTGYIFRAVEISNLIHMCPQITPFRRFGDSNHNCLSDGRAPLALCSAFFSDWNIRFEATHLNRQWQFFFLPCTLPQNPATVTDQSSILAIFIDSVPFVRHLARTVMLGARKAESPSGSGYGWSLGRVPRCGRWFQVENGQRARWQYAVYQGDEKLLPASCEVPEMSTGFAAT